MGMIVFAATPASNWKPGDYGLIVGNTVQAIVVGGGAGGQGSGGLGGNGYQSSFGTIATAAGGGYSAGYGHAGPGGYIPGVVRRGGITTYTGAVYGTSTNPVIIPPPPGLAGSLGTAYNQTFGIPSSNGYGGLGGIGITGISPAGTSGSNYGSGGSGSGSNFNMGGHGGGGGYGAGGAGGGSNYAGDPGKIVYASVILTSDHITNGIPITVGGGGGGAGYSGVGYNGSSSGGGSGGPAGGSGGYNNVAGGSGLSGYNGWTGGGGAGGCVILFW